MNKTLKVVLSVAIVIALGGAYVFPQIPVFLGSVAGPDVYFDYFGVNDVRTYSTRQALATATTTPCAIKSPSATSTLVHSSLKITTATSTATTWTLAKSATPTATTTALSTYTLGSGALGTMVSTSTSATAIADGLNVVAPNSYIVWGVAGLGALTSDKLLGICQAQFLEI